jgi:NADPH-dependent glutamate synthase beta subunit-like oxidoreductase
VGPTPVLHALKYFADDFKQALSGKKSETHHKYYTKLTAPCIDACPIHLDVPKYVELIKDAKFDQSLEVIRERLPLPGVFGRACFRPCEQNCRRANVDKSIAIRALKRFVADHGFGTNQPSQPKITPSPKTGKVAIIGSGPAGITCAYHLALKGHNVHVFERLSVAGGMMRVGIPPYRVPEGVTNTEIQRLQDMGVGMQTGMEVGKNITIEQLRKQGYQAIFLSIGAHECKSLGIEGENLDGVYPGVDFLREANLGKKITLGNRIAVIGGGNVAMDSVRTVRRLGATAAFIIYRRSLAEMPAHEEEIEECKEEGIQIHTLTTPKRIIGENGKVKAIECIKMTLGEPDASGRPRPIPVAGSEFLLEVDGVIPALGQESDWACLGPECVCTLSDWGTLNANPFTMQTDEPDIFAGGDAVSGPKTLVEAAAAGKRAAVSIDHFLNGLPVEPDNDEYFDRLFASLKLYDPREAIKKVETRERRDPARLSAELRIGNFDEVEQGLSSPDAAAEAERCLRCYRVVTVVV